MELVQKKSSPWKRQRRLKREDIPHQEQIIRMAKSYWDIRDRALFIMTYLTAGRISEIVEKKYLYKVTYKKSLQRNNSGNMIHRIVRNDNGSPIAESIEKIEINFKGITKKDIFLTEKKKKSILMISMPNRKNKRYTRKNIPIPANRESELINMLYEYLNTLYDEQPLFPFKIWKAEKIIAKIDMNPHFLRDIRLTHMVTIYDFNAFQLTKFAGWKDVSPAERYVRLGITDLIDKF